MERTHNHHNHNKYNIVETKKQIKNQSFTSPICFPEVPGTYLSTDLRSHAPDRCVDLPKQVGSLLDNSKHLDIFLNTSKRLVEIKWGCGSHLFAKKCPQDGFVRYVMSSCNKRTCPRCAKRRRMRFINQYFEWVQDFRYPIFITLTLRRRSDLATGVDEIVKAFHKLRRQKWWEVRTGFWCLEVVEKQDGWHIHLHCLADAVWVDWKKLSKRWKKLTESFIVDVRRVQRLRLAMLEMFKYITKLWEMSKEGKMVMNMVLKNKRFMNYFGEKPVTSEYHYDNPNDYCPLCGSKLILDEVLDLNEGRDFYDTS